MRRDCVIGLGSNIGDRLEHLRVAVTSIAKLGELQAVSALYETDPVGPPQARFLNAAVRLSTQRDPSQLLTRLLEIEALRGRVRGPERWQPRSLDLDILHVVGHVERSPGLVLPHPELLKRRFALQPLLDVLPDAKHPVTGQALSAFLEALPEAGMRCVGELVGQAVTELWPDAESRLFEQ